MISAALREKKELLLSSNPDKFIEAMSTTLVHVASSDYLQLEHIDPHPITRSDFFSYLRRFVIALITGAIPLILIIIFQQTTYALSSPLSGTVTIVAIIWLLVSLLSVIDPLFNDKLDAVKDVMDINPFRNR